MSTKQPLANLADMVRERATSRGNATAYEFEGRVTSFAEFDVKTNKVAGALIEMGVRRGERIAYLGKNSDIYFELLMGAMKAGVVMAPVNWRLASPEVAFIVSDCKAPVLFVGPEFIAQVSQIKDELPGVRTVITTEGGAPEWPDYTAWRDAQSGDDPGVPIDTRDIAIQLYTSGTTGKPKGAMLSHANFLNLVQTGNAEDKPEWNRWSTDDVSLVAMPIFHIGGSGWGVMGLYHGARGVIAREFDPTKVLDFFEQSGITKLFMVPAGDAVRGAAATRQDGRFLAVEIHAVRCLPDSRGAAEGVHRDLQMRLRADVRYDRDHWHHRRAAAGRPRRGTGADALGRQGAAGHRDRDP
ncbi:acyl-CoA synthetase (AMP-forming)/AMP-acid ligase II [Bradyrhizobium sp. LB7.1]